MRFVTQSEIEYLGSNDQRVAADPNLIDEMSQRLNALRRYDQNFSESDWRPHAGEVGWCPDIHLRAI
jgi:hypothetical protein